MIADLPRLVTDRTATGIAAAIGREIRSGAVPPGTRLPTVREVAGALRVSPATVGQAWQALASAGMIDARGRAGTFVLDGPSTEPALHRSRYWRLHSPSASDFTLDLSQGTPDPALLPSISIALAASAQIDLASDYLGDAVLPELDAYARADWPFVPDRIAVVDGALDAVDRLIGSCVRLGDRVVVEDPCFPPFLDIIAGVGGIAVPVEVDRDGIIPSELARAISGATPAVLLLQPRAHNPTGASFTARRCRELGGVLRRTDVKIFEDDHSGDIAWAPDVSLGSLFPDRTVHIRSYSKSHGADLRVAVLGGAAHLVDEVVARRMLGPGWTSRLLQRLLLNMLGDASARACVDLARQTYRARGLGLEKLLTDKGIDARCGDGLNMWIPVLDETAALVTLAAAGIKTSPGTPFMVDEGGRSPHIRVTSAVLQERDAEWVSTEIAKAATSEPVYARRPRRI